MNPARQPPLLVVEIVHPVSFADVALSMLSAWYGPKSKVTAITTKTPAKAQPRFKFIAFATSSSTFSAAHRPG
jgi:hypothetical protein